MQHVAANQGVLMFQQVREQIESLLVGMFFCHFAAFGHFVTTNIYIYIYIYIYLSTHKHQYYRLARVLEGNVQIMYTDIYVYVYIMDRARRMCHVAAIYCWAGFFCWSWSSFSRGEQGAV